MKKTSSKTHKKMKRSNLVQRLLKPLPTQEEGIRLDEVFAFGGGLTRGGLSKEAWDLLREIWTWDYMGSAEFEFGAVPEALQSIAKSGDLMSYAFEIPLRDVPKDPRDEGPQDVEGMATIYMLCPADIIDEAQARIATWATETYNADLKEATRLTSSLRPRPGEGEVGERMRSVGWIELDNGFMFFTDETMWNKTCALFEVN